MFGRKKKADAVQKESVNKQAVKKRVLPFNPLIILFCIIGLTAFIGFYSGYCVGKGAVVTPAIEKAVLDFSGGKDAGHGTAEDHGYYSEKNDEVGWVDTAQKPYDESSANAMQGDSGSFSYSEKQKQEGVGPQSMSAPNMQGENRVGTKTPGNDTAVGDVVNGHKVIGVEYDKYGNKTVKYEDKDFQRYIEERSKKNGI